MTLNAFIISQKIHAHGMNIYVKRSRIQIEQFSLAIVLFYMRRSKLC